MSGMEEPQYPQEIGMRSKGYQESGGMQNGGGDYDGAFRGITRARVVIQQKVVALFQGITY
jgi:hypothetical protein